MWSKKIIQINQDDLVLYWINKKGGVAEFLTRLSPSAMTYESTLKNLTDLIIYISCPKVPMIKSNQGAINNILKHMLNKSSPLIASIQDAFFHLFVPCLEPEEPKLKNIINTLAIFEIVQSPYFILSYVKQNPFSDKYGESLKSILDDPKSDLENIFYTSKNIVIAYLSIGSRYLLQNKYNESKKYFLNALEYKNISPAMTQLLYIALMQKEWLEVIKWSETILNNPKHCNYVKTKSLYTLIKIMYFNALNKTGQEEKATALIKAELEEKIKEFRKKTVNVKIRKKPDPKTLELLRARQQELKELLNKNHFPKISNEASSSSQKDKGKQKNSSDLLNIKKESDYQFLPQKEKYEPTNPKRKLKTRGTISHLPTETNSEVKKDNIHKFRIENFLSSKNYETFCKFFDNYFYDTTDNHIKIPYKKFKTLCESLNQDIDESISESSHQKLTFDPSLIDFSLKDCKKGMKIIVKKTDLIPAQIKDIREMFLRYGFYPKYLENTLIEKKLL